MRRIAYLGTFGQKSDPAIRSRDLDFLYNRCILTTEWRLRDIFYVFVLLRRMTLWPWPFTFWTSVSHVQCYSCPTHIPIFIILGLLVTELRVLNIWSHFRYLKQSLRMRSVTWPVHTRSPKTTRNNFWPQIAYLLYNFYGATMTIKGSLYWRFSVAKKPSPVKICPKNCSLSEI